MSPDWDWLALPAVYLLASVSPAYLIARMKGVDLRKQGSGNLGATNAGRVLGTRYFFLVFALDMLKGLLPVLAAQQLVRHGASPLLPAGTGLFALLGHSFTCFHRFRGGKAVATSLGLLIGLVPLVAAISLSAWIVTWAIGYACRMGAAVAVTPASVVAALTVPIAHFLTAHAPWSWQLLPTTLLCLTMSLLVLVRHRSNLLHLVRRRPAVPSSTKHASAKNEGVGAG